MGGISRARRLHRAEALARRQARRAAPRRRHPGRALMLDDLCPPERRVFAALAKMPRTLQEIERWGQFRGKDERARQQCVCRCLHRLIEKGLAEKTSRRRADARQGWDCAIYRLTRKGELWALSG